MALGERTTFEFNRFLKDFKCADAIAVTCKTSNEVHNFYRFLKEAKEFKNDLLPSSSKLASVLRELEEGSEWVNFYCHGPSEGLRCDVISSEDSNNTTYATDYYYSDIAFTEPVKVSKVELFDFLKG